MISLRPFKKHDWYGFAGAESFADGSEPLIGEMQVVHAGETHPAIVIVDANGLALDIITDEGDNVASCYFGNEYATRALASLHDGVSTTELRAMPGAEYEAHPDAA